MRISGTRKTSLVDGIGVNYVIYAQGCPHGCAGCHNPSTHDPLGGYEVSIEDLKNDIVSNALITGVTFSGGEPLDQYWEVYDIAMWAKEQRLQTTLYTGYNVEIINENLIVYRLNGMDGISKTAFDYIIDGPFDITKKSIDCPFRGSTNQRILVKGKDY